MDDLLRESLAELEHQLGELQANLNAANARLAKDDCQLCNYLERGDCHMQKESLRDEIKKLRYENEQLRETVTNQEIVIRCHQEACQALDSIGIGD